MLPLAKPPGLARPLSISGDDGRWDREGTGTGGEVSSKEDQEAGKARDPTKRSRGPPGVDPPRCAGSLPSE